MSEGKASYEQAVELLGDALGSSMLEGSAGVYTRIITPKRVRMNKFSLFWIKFWYRIGWRKRAQWIILQNLKAAK